MTDKATQLVKELTMEYVKQNKMLSCSESEIESQVQKIAKVSQVIHDSVQKNFHDIKFL